MRGRELTEAERIFVRSNYTVMSDETIAGKLHGVSKSAVTKCRQREGLRKKRGRPKINV